MRFRGRTGEPDNDKIPLAGVNGDAGFWAHFCLSYALHLMDTDKQFIIIGAGPAGLSAAYELTRHGVTPIVLEKDAIVGGIARTETYKGYHFDMGGHRFFTKSIEIDDFWHEVLADDFLRRPRLSRIYYKGKFFNYPLKAFNSLKNLGLIESCRVAASYVRWKLFPYKTEETFEHWVTNRFGRRLFETFFKTYTEKVWGISCSELKAEWAAQRIKDLSLRTAILSMFFRSRKQIKTLIESFEYPRRGPGMLWNAVRRQIESRGGEVRMSGGVTTVHRQDMRITAVSTAVDGKVQRVEGTHFISSMPITDLMRKLDPPPPPQVLEAASKLRYRDFLTVCLIVNCKELFPDNWIYIHDASVKVGRIQNFKNWSPEMVPDLSKSSLGLEYFCTEGDELWNKSDAELIEQAKREIDQIGLARREDIEDGCVFRVPKSYPMYDGEYGTHLQVVREYVAGFTNLHTIGRNGLHRYNNQDHSMLTGIYAARNLLLGEANDVWSVNADLEYHEQARTDGPGRNRQRWAPPDEQIEQQELALVFAKFDRLAMGVATGTIAAALLWIVTFILAIKGGSVVGQTLGLLGQYFPGYRVTFRGALVGAIYAFIVFGLIGWAVAAIRNVTLFLYWIFIRRHAEHEALRHLMDIV
jgi:protoporphyrinogen oxidase